jgi:NADH-quinone oxidoreductase subunit K
MTVYTTYIFILFFIGMLGIFITRKNIIIILMCIELMLLAVNMYFIVYSVYLDDILGQVFALFILTVAAAESAIGLAILLVYYRITGTILTLFIKNLKGG